MIEIVHELTRVMAPWAELYNDSTWLQSAVAFAHLAGVLLGGGLALAADRKTLRAANSAPAVRRDLVLELATVHRPVIIGLAVAFASGLLLFAADVETFAVSPVFWGKMGVIAVLLTNGYALQRTERRLRAALKPGVAGWRALRRAARASVVLWFLSLLAGVLLMNAA